MNLPRVKRILKSDHESNEHVISLFTFFSLKIDTSVSHLSESQIIATELETHSNHVPKLGKDLNLADEKMFSSFYFLLISFHLHSRVSFFLQVLSSSFRTTSEGKCGSSWAMDHRSISLSLPQVLQRPTGHAPRDSRSISTQLERTLSQGEAF